nr:TetR/AcrR family transcriptional regulator [Pedococcus sp. 5OH_020]
MIIRGPRTIGSRVDSTSCRLLDLRYIGCSVNRRGFVPRRVVEVSEPAARGRPRRAETDERLTRAATELLREKGPAGVSIEAVASRSGVARTTIYRRFDSRRQLIAAVIDPVVDRRPLPPLELPLREKVRWVLEQVAELFETGLGRGAIAAIVSDEDPDFTGALRHALERRLAALQAQISADIDSGQVARHVEPDAVVGLLVGAYLAEVLRRGEPRTSWTDDTVDLVTKALEVRPDSP